MNNKILVEITVPTIERNFELFIPVGKSVKRVIYIIQKNINNLTRGEYIIKPNANLYIKENGMLVAQDKLVKDTDIKNGFKIVIF